MPERHAPTELEIQDFVDGRLNPRHHELVTEWLVANPDAAADVAALREQNELLRVLGQEILDEPVPERLSQILRRPMTARPAPAIQSFHWRSTGILERYMAFLQAAAAVLLVCVGGVIGWFSNDYVRPRPSVEDMIFAAVSDAYSMDRASYPLSFPPDRSADFAAWINRAFEREIPLPDLAPLGFSYAGGQIVPTGSRRAGYFEFQGPEKTRIAVIFWPVSSPKPQILHAASDKIASRFWLGPGVRFAVLGAPGSPNFDKAADAVFRFYAEALGVT